MQPYTSGPSSFNGILILFFLFFILVFIAIITQMVQGGVMWNKNNKSPILTVHASVTGKRADVSRHNHMDNDNMAMNNSMSSTTYYVTFQVDSGDHIEFHVPDGEYGRLVEADKGNLTFQGTSYKSFIRREIF